MNTTRSKPVFHILAFFALVVSLLGSAVFVTPAYAAALTVTNTNDSGPGSLRDTLASAGVGDTITFAAGLSGQTIYLASTLTISQDATIDGSSLASQITLSGDSNTDSDPDGDVRILDVNGGVTATLDSMVFTKGYTTSDGGAIYNSGTLTVTDSTFSGNSASNVSGAISNGGALNITNSAFSGNSAKSGGGIYNNGGTLTVANSTFTGNSATTNGGGGIYNLFGTLTITNSTFSSNSAAFDGGGVKNYAGTLTITDSTLFGNTAVVGGGVVSSGGMVAVTSSTFSGNSAAYGGGGISNSDSPLTVTNSTFSANSADVGGGIYNWDATLTIKNSTLSGNSASVGEGGGISYGGSTTLNYANTIIANSTLGDDCDSSGGSIGTNTNNLVEDASCSAALSGDPNLGALAANGGPTQTFALLAGSIAINAGNNTTCTAAPTNSLDQRGFSRPNGPQCDIGAYEYVDTTSPTVITFTVPSTSSSFNIPITAFTASDDVSVSGYKITENATPPSAGGAGWTGSAPSTYIVGSDGSYTFYPWVKDAIGHVSAVFGSPASVSVDKTAPTITINNPDTSAATSKTITASASDGTLSMKNTSGSTCNGSLTFNAYSSQTFSSESDNGIKVCYKAVDTFGNTRYSMSNAIAGIDTTAPTISSITRVTTSPTNATSVDFTVTFSESVTGVGTDDFDLTVSSVTGASVSGLTGSGTTYTVSVNTGSDDGSIRLDVLDDDTIMDAAGNALNGGLTSGESYSMDKNAPTITINNPDTSAAASKTITASIPDGTLSMSNTTGSTCDGSLTFIAYSSQTFTSESDNGAKVCYKAVDTAGNSAYSLSNAIAGIDTSAPTIIIYNSDTSPALSKTITASVSDGTLTMSNTTGSTCNGTLTFITYSSQTFTSESNNGTKVCYKAVDAPGNTSYNLSNAIAGIDTTAPMVNTFTVTSPSASLNIPITAFTASDAVGVTGYKITTSSTPPAAGAVGWSVSAPTTYTVGSAGTYTLYPWAKDAAGHVSAVFGSPRNVTVTAERARNGGFNTYIGAAKIPQYWVKSATFAATDGKTTTVKKEGIASIKIAGAPGKTKTLTQTLALSGAAGSTFTFSFWARGASIPVAGLCQAQVLLYNGAVLKLTKTVSCKTGTYLTFQKKTLTFNATSAYTKVVIRFTYSKASGTVWFDAVSLIR
jgi:hypothetical protein